MWYRKAAKQAHPEAMHNLAMAYARGEGTARNPMQAIFWLSWAARIGSEKSAAQLPSLLADTPRVKVRQVAPIMSNMDDKSEVAVRVVPGTTLFRLDYDSTWSAVYVPNGHYFGFIRNQAVAPVGG